MIKAIIFDLNGLFIQSPYMSDRFQEKFGIPTEDFLPALKKIMAQVRMPNAPGFYQLWEPYLEKWGIKLTEQEFFDFGFTAEKENQELVNVVQELKARGLKLFILSNNFKERTTYYNQRFLFLKTLFDKVYYSWQTGFVKPSPEAYKNLLGENNFKPEECLYFDDSEDNVKVANSLGINSYLFKSVGQVKQVLRKNQLKFAKET